MAGGSSQRKPVGHLDLDAKTLTFLVLRWVFPGATMPCGAPLVVSLVVPAVPPRCSAQVAKTEGFAARLRSVQILVLDEVDQLASVAGFVV